MTQSAPPSPSSAWYAPTIADIEEIANEVLRELRETPFARARGAIVDPRP